MPQVILHRDCLSMHNLLDEAFNWQKTAEIVVINIGLPDSFEVEGVGPHPPEAARKP
jgi:hypothetical protein